MPDGGEVFHVGRSTDAAEVNAHRLLGFLGMSPEFLGIRLDLVHELVFGNLEDDRVARVCLCGKPGRSECRQHQQKR